MNDSDLANSVYAAVYSGIPVYEMICRGIAVMRRHSDSWLNATQILKVAGVEKGRRTKILEREVLTGEHEKIQGGYGKYQGTWVPFTRGVQLCKQYNVYEYIRPILEHDPTASGTRPDRTPTKAEVRKLMKSSQHRSSTVRSSNGPASSTKRGRNDNESTAGKRYKISSSAATSPLHSDIATPYQLNGLAHVNPSSAGYPPRENGGPAIPRATGQPLSQTPRSTTLYSSPAARHRNAELAAMPAASNAWGYSSINEDVSSQTMAESDPSGNAYNARVEHDRMLLMNIFLNEDPNYIPDWLSQIDEAATGSPRSRSNATPNDTPASVNVDLVIDDQGHTAVHWAAALARIHVLDLLLYQNSDARKLNYEGESALVRAVQVTNNYEAQTFPDLLELLHDTIPLTDKNNRTVLHHIALTAGIDGRDKAARYYADCLLSWIVRLAGGYQVENGDIAENGMSDGQNAEPCTADILRQQQSGANAADQSNGEPASIEPSSAAKPVSENGRSIHSLPTPMQSSSPNPKRQPFADLAYESSLSAVQSSSTQASTAKDNFQGSPATLHRQPAAVSLSDGGRQNSAQSDSAQNADFAAFLNLQDVHGNTALSIAARVGDRAIIRMLLNAGASATIQNRVGLCPLDFGVDKITCSDSDPSSLLDAAFGAVGGSLAPQPSFANGSDMLNSPTLSGRTRTQLPQTPLRQGARG
ncbi:transcriptional regulator swi6, partial [Dipsacomyces acuminosporus]